MCRLHFCIFDSEIVFVIIAPRSNLVDSLDRNNEPLPMGKRDRLAAKGHKPAEGYISAVENPDCIKDNRGCSKEHI